METTWTVQTSLDQGSEFDVLVRQRSIGDVKDYTDGSLS